MKAAEEVLQSLLQNSKSPLSDQFLRWRLWKAWPTVVGEKLAARSQPVGYSRGTLYVWVESSSWLQELTYFHRQIRDKSNAFAGKSWIRSVRFTLDKKSVPTNPEDQAALEKFLEKRSPK
jgi:predicted nucleic acid-binding Zn ribbon protein